MVSALDLVFTEQTNMTFREALLKDKSLGLENKKSQYEKRKEKRELEILQSRLTNALQKKLQSRY